MLENKKVNAILSYTIMCHIEDSESEKTVREIIRHMMKLHAHLEEDGDSKLRLYMSGYWSPVEDDSKHLNIDEDHGVEIKMTRRGWVLDTEYGAIKIHPRPELGESRICLSCCEKKNGGEHE